MINLYNLFKRNTNSKNFIPEIDGLRFFAIFTVLIFHANTALYKILGFSHREWQEFVSIQYLFDLGWWVIRMDVGVKVFFGLSGFILAIPFLKSYYAGDRIINLKNYFWRRFTRLEPPYIISLIVFYLVHVFVLDENFIGLVPNFFSGILYSHVFFYGYNNPINPVTWSLETEAQFYLILPFLFMAYNSFKSSLAKIIFVLLLFFLSVYLKSYFYYNDIVFLSKSIFAFLTNFMTGIFFAHFFLLYKDKFLKKKFFSYDFLGVLSLFCMFYFYKPQANYFSNLVLNLSIFLLFISVFKGRVFNWFFTRKFIYLIGGMCYSIYLLHFAWFKFIITYSVNLFSENQYWISFLFQFIIMFTTVILISSLFYILVEKPCMDKNWPKKIKNFKLKIKWR